MLTDIFARRYEKVPMWPTYTEASRRLIAQTFQLLVELVPYYGADGNVLSTGKEFWTDLHSLLARELGVRSSHHLFGAIGLASLSVGIAEPTRWFRFAKHGRLHRRQQERTSTSTSRSVLVSSS